MLLRQRAAPAQPSEPLEGQPLEHAQKTRVQGLLQVGCSLRHQQAPRPQRSGGVRSHQIHEGQLHPAPLLLRPLGKASGPISIQAVLAPAGERIFGWQPQATRLCAAAAHYACLCLISEDAAMFDCLPALELSKLSLMTTVKGVLVVDAGDERVGDFNLTGHGRRPC